MKTPFDHMASANCFVSYRDDRELCTRVQAEFVEMPGLRLTLSQAVRLFSIEPDQCERVLGTLVLCSETATGASTRSALRDWS